MAQRAGTFCPRHGRSRSFCRRHSRGDLRSNPATSCRFLRVPQSSSSGNRSLPSPRVTVVRREARCHTGDRFLLPRRGTEKRRIPERSASCTSRRGFVRDEQKRCCATARRVRAQRSACAVGLASISAAAPCVLSRRRRPPLRAGLGARRGGLDARKREWFVACIVAAWEIRCAP